MRNEIGRPMTFARRCAVAVAVVAAVGGPVAGGAIALQSQVVVPPAAPAFETITVKQGTPFRGVPPDQLAIEAAMLNALLSASQDDGSLKASGTLHSLIQAAYGVSGLQVEGGPSWARSDRYMIQARSLGTPSPDRRHMLQSVIADRFKLALRRETRTLPVYELVIADGGRTIAAMREGDCISREAIRWDLVDLEAPLYICNSFRRRTLSQTPETRPRPQWPRVQRLEAGRIVIAALIDHISADVDRIIVDKTGFTAPFNLLLDYAPASSPDSGPLAYSGPTIFAALEEQLGLRLVPAEGRVDVLVIDRAEPPAGN